MRRCTSYDTHAEPCGDTPDMWKLRDLIGTFRFYTGFTPVRCRLARKGQAISWGKQDAHGG